MFEQLLPLEVGGNGKSTGKRLVNNQDLLENRNAAGALSPLPLHKFTAPERSGNQLPQTAGASLVVIYRDLAEPLRKILVYDGIAVLPDLPLARLVQPIHGIYQSDTSNKSARLTHIVTGGQPNNNERIYFNGTGPTSLVAANNPFPPSSSASDRSWAHKTLDSNVLNPLMPGGPDTDPNVNFGETVTTTVDHSNLNPYDCLSWAAIIFSTTRQR